MSTERIPLDYTAELVHVNEPANGPVLGGAIAGTPRKVGSQACIYRV